MDVELNTSNIPETAKTPPALVEINKSKERRGGKRLNAGRPQTRPRDASGRILQTASDNKTPLVLPQLPNGSSAQPLVFLKWWHDLTEAQINAMMIYVYRTWPLVDAKFLNPKAESNIRKYSERCPFALDRWEKDIMTEFGSGDYRFTINEGSIHRWDVYVKGLRDLENYPPLIDHRSLMVGDPANKTYVQWATLRGKMKDTDYKSEDDMAVNNAVEQLAENNSRLTDTVISLAERNRQPVETGQDSNPVVVEILRDALKDAREDARAAKDAVEKPADPFAIVDRVVNTATTLIGAGRGDDGSKLIIDMLQKTIDRQDLRLERLENDLRDKSTTTGPMSGLKDVSDMVNQLSELGLVKKNGSGNEQGEGGSDNGNNSGGKTNLKSMLLEGLVEKLPQMLGQGGLNGLVDKLVMGIVALRTPPPAPGSATSPPSTPTPIAASSSSTTQTAPIMIAGFPQPESTGDTQVDGYLEFVWRISPTLIHHMSAEDLDGYSFARWLIDSAPDGRGNYDAIREAGIERLKALIKAYSPLYTVVNRTPQKFDNFLSEFLKLDEYEARQEEEDDDGEEEENKPDEIKPVTGEVVK